jgi:hypothetical protein
MPISATKNGITRNFSDTQWRNMPSDKYGWKQIAAGENTTVAIPEELIQKKMVAGAIDVKPVEIVKPIESKMDVPEELIAKPKREPVKREPKKGAKK